MAQYSPPSRNYPQELPDRWKFEDGTVRTDLQSLTDAELEALGWHGPITMPEDIPNTSSFTHNYTWNRDTLSFDVEEVDQYEKRRRVDYRRFWNQLLETNAYSTIKTQASTSLLLNTIVTEFISLLSDARSTSDNEHAKVSNIQQSLSNILSNVTLTDEELAEIQQVFTESGMFAIYTLA